MKLGVSQGKLVGLTPADRWTSLDSPVDDIATVASDPNLLAHLGAQLSREGPDDMTAPSGLPFAPQSLRAFAIWQSHMENGARGMVRRFAPGPLRAVVAGYEQLTRSTFPALRPKSNYFRFPQFYMGNHRSIVPDGTTIEWPSFASVLDFELEIGVVLSQQVRDCTPAEGHAAIGGFVVMNDWSARDTQWDDTRRGTFGGVVKAKTFAGAMSSVFVTADEVLPSFDRLSGRVRVNGDVWCEGSTTGALFTPGDMVAYASRGETLLPGDVLSTGTLPGCCGLELGRFPEPGDVVQLEIDGLGTLTNQLGARIPAKAPASQERDRS